MLVVVVVVVSTGGWVKTIASGLPGCFSISHAIAVSMKGNIIVFCSSIVESRRPRLVWATSLFNQREVNEYQESFYVSKPLLLNGEKDRNSLQGWEISANQENMWDVGRPVTASFAIVFGSGPTIDNLSEKGTVS